MDARQLLGIRVKEIRTQLGLSQEELAFRCGMHASHIGFLERGQRNPSLDTLERISLGLGVPLTALFDYDNEPSTAVYDETTNKIISYVIGLSPSETRRQDNLAIPVFLSQYPTAGRHLHQPRS